VREREREREREEETLQVQMIGTKEGYFEIAN